jgi:hypothetical protein
MDKLSIMRLVGAGIEWEVRAFEACNELGIVDDGVRAKWSR